MLRTYTRNAFKRILLGMVGFARVEGSESAC